jgi:hypothetical protein
VDGRPYADPGLLQRLEEYHHEAAHAHREHGTIPLSMPEASRPVLTAGPWLVNPDPDSLNGS